MTCKDCAYYTACEYWGEDFPATGLTTPVIVENVEKFCPIFKNKSKFIELPCKLGDKVYSVSRNCSDAICLGRDCDKCPAEYEVNEDVADWEIIGAILGHTAFEDVWFFLDKEEAQKKARELDEGKLED